MHESVEQCKVSARAMLEVQIRILGDVDASRISDNELGATMSLRAPDLCPNNGMVFCGIGANDKNALTLFRDIGDGVGHRTAAKSHHQTGDCAGVSQPGTVIDTVRC